MLDVLLWIAFAIWSFVFRRLSDTPHMRVTVQLFTGQPDAIGAYEVTTLTRDWTKQ